jgi:hypothetical protein
LNYLRIAEDWFHAVLSSVGLPRVLSLVARPMAVLTGTPTLIALSASESRRFVDNLAPVARPALVKVIALSFIKGIVYGVVSALSHLFQSTLPLRPSSNLGIPYISSTDFPSL